MFPLVSKLMIPAVSQGLNATRIACMDRSTTAPMATTVYIVYEGRILIFNSNHTA